MQKGIALECTTSSSIIKIIHQAISKNMEYEQKCNDYIKNYFYKSDGLAAERISNSVLELVKNKLE